LAQALATDALDERLLRIAGGQCRFINIFWQTVDRKPTPKVYSRAHRLTIIEKKKWTFVAD
jgi:hypothetical protein